METTTLVWSNFLNSGCAVWVQPLMYPQRNCQSAGNTLKICFSMMCMHVEEVRKLEIQARAVMGLRHLTPCRISTVAVLCERWLAKSTNKNCPHRSLVLQGIGIRSMKGYGVCSWAWIIFLQGVFAANAPNMFLEENSIPMCVL